MNDKITVGCASELKHAAAIRYWVSAAREQSRWFVQLRSAYRAEPNGLKRARLWGEGSRCRDRIPYLMTEARSVRAALARIGP